MYGDTKWSWTHTVRGAIEWLRAPLAPTGSRLGRASVKAPVPSDACNDVMRSQAREQVMLCISLLLCDGDARQGKEVLIRRTFLRNAGGKDSKSASDILLLRAIADAASPLSRGILAVLSLRPAACSHRSTLGRNGGPI